MLFQPTSYLKRLIIEMMYVYEKTNTNLMRPQAGSEWVITRYVTSTLIINTLIKVKHFGDTSSQVTIARYIVSIILHMLAT